MQVWRILFAHTNINNFENQTIKEINKKINNLSKAFSEKKTLIELHFKLANAEATKIHHEEV